MRPKLGHCLIAWTTMGLGFFVPMRDQIDDPDIWWHLKTGELICANHSVPATDPFSFTAQGQPWVAHEWLSDIILYGIFAQFGFVGLTLFTSTMITALMAGLYLLVRRRMDYGPLALGITALCGIAGWQLWSARPQLFTYLLLVGLLFILQNPKGKGIWLAIPMFWLWGNLHGAWALGFGIMVITLAGSVWEKAGHSFRVGIGRMALICILSLAAVMIGPSPLERLVYPLSYFSGQIPAGYVQEFQSPNFWELGSYPFELLLMATGVLLYLGRKPLRASEWILLGLMLHLSLHSVRHIPLMAIVAAPILAYQASGLVGRPKAETREITAINLLALIVLPLMIWMRLPKFSDEAQWTGHEFPREACEYLLQHPKVGRGRLLNSYDWGGYLIYRLYPKYQVSIDGRADVHHRHMKRDLKAFDVLSPNWAKELRRQDPDVILWPKDKPLAIVLRQDDSWRLVHKDGKAVVFAGK